MFNIPVILRIDVDRAYEDRILHYLRVNQELFPALDPQEYLESCKEVINDLNSRGLKASIFFQPFTVPNKDFAQELVKEGHSVGLHAVHTKDFKDFSGDLTKISKRFEGIVYGFTKHGFKMEKMFILAYKKISKEVRDMRQESEDVIEKYVSDMGGAVE